MAEPQIRIGCSGWQYRHWRGRFYPDELAQSRWFEHYATQFDTVELNNPFYRLPDRETFVRWRTAAPRGFLFAVKASRYLTHMKKLKDAAEPLARLFNNVRGLGRRLGPVLYQLPPHWGRDAERLDSFLALIPRDVPQAIEFRDPSWYCDEIYEQLERHRVALCLHDMKGSASGRLSVGPFVYVRFHGAGSRYGGRYPHSTLADWAKWLSEQHAKGRPIYAYFNNDAGGHAPRDAQRLTARLARLTAQDSGLKGLKPGAEA